MRLFGIYRADGGLIGELRYLTGHLFRGEHGGFNWSSQHLEGVEVFDGGNCGLEQEDQRCSRGRAPAVAC